MLKIRLQRVGKRKQAYFRFVLTEHTRKPKGKYLEFLGSWNPHQDKITLDAERINHWLSQGAQPSDTAHNLLVENGLLKERKRAAWKPKKKKEKVEAKGAVLPTPATPSEPAAKPEEKKETETKEEVKVTAPEKSPEKQKEEPKSEDKPIKGGENDKEV